MSRVILTDNVERHMSMKVRQFFGIIVGIILIIIGIVAFFQSEQFKMILILVLPYFSPQYLFL